jgi:hypothetical protein
MNIPNVSSEGGNFFKSRLEDAKNAFIITWKNDEEIYNPQTAIPYTEDAPLICLLICQFGSVITIKNELEKFIMSASSGQLVKSDEGDLEIEIRKEQLVFNQKVFYTNDFLTLGDKKYLIKIIPR